MNASCPGCWALVSQKTKGTMAWPTGAWREVWPHWIMVVREVPEADPEGDRVRRWLPGQEAPRAALWLRASLGDPHQIIWAGRWGEVHPAPLLPPSPAHLAPSCSDPQRGKKGSNV